MPQRTFEARDEQLAAASDFVEEYLARQECPPRFVLALLTALEEVFVNVAHYSGSPTVEIDVEKTPQGLIRLCFADQGAPFDPLARADPRLDAPLSEREIGGLGIVMVKRLTDRVTYRYDGGRNVLTLEKNIPT